MQDKKKCASLHFHKSFTIISRFHHIFLISYNYQGCKKPFYIDFFSYFQSQPEGILTGSSLFIASVFSSFCLLSPFPSFYTFVDEPFVHFVHIVIKKGLTYMPENYEQFFQNQNRRRPSCPSCPPCRCEHDRRDDRHDDRRDDRQDRRRDHHDRNDIWPWR